MLKAQEGEGSKPRMESAQNPGWRVLRAQNRGLKAQGGEGSKPRIERGSNPRMERAQSPEWRGLKAQDGELRDGVQYT